MWGFRKRVVFPDTSLNLYTSAKQHWGGLMSRSPIDMPFSTPGTKRNKCYSERWSWSVRTPPTVQNPPRFTLAFFPTTKQPCGMYIILYITITAHAKKTCPNLRKELLRTSSVVLYSSDRFFWRILYTRS